MLHRMRVDWDAESATGGIEAAIAPSVNVSPCTAARLHIPVSRVQDGGSRQV